MLKRQQSLAGCSRISARSQLAEFGVDTGAASCLSDLVGRLTRWGRRWDTQVGKAASGERGSLGDVPLAARYLQLTQLVSQSLIDHSAVSGRRVVSQTSCGGNGK